MLCAHLQLALEPRVDHAPYVQNWLKALRNDKRAIFTAASKAQEAVTYLQELAGIPVPRAAERGLSSSAHSLTTNIPVSCLLCRS